jgi:hypothetical protein
MSDLVFIPLAPLLPLSCPLYPGISLISCPRLLRRARHRAGFQSILHRHHITTLTKADVHQRSTPEAASRPTDGKTCMNWKRKMQSQTPRTMYVVFLPYDGGGFRLLQCSISGPCWPRLSICCSAPAPPPLPPQDSRQPYALNSFFLIFLYG